MSVVRLQEGMGCCCSEDVDFTQQWLRHGRAFSALKLTRSDVNLLWRLFQKMDLGRLAPMKRTRVESGPRAARVRGWLCGCMRACVHV